MSEPNETTHQKVRIAVAVDCNGDWNSCGYMENGEPESDAELAALAREHVDHGEIVSFVEAWVPRPNQSFATIQGEVPRPQPNESETQDGE